MAISFVVNDRLDSGGGIWSDGLSESIRLIRSLDAGLPGTIATVLDSPWADKALSAISNLRSDFWLSVSGPWHAKHLSESIGFT